MDNQQVQDGVLQQLMTQTDLWNFEDVDEQRDIIEKILEADLQARRIPIKLKEAEAIPQIKLAECEVRKASIEAESQIKLARIETEAATERAVRAAAAPYQWRKHLVWAAAICGLVYMLLPYIARTL